MAVTKTDIARYTLLPGILPRMWALVASGFAFLAGLVAVIYYNVGLLPAGHPYLNPENTGRYGIRHVVAAAANNLVFTRRHADQVVVFFTILTGLALMALQIVLLVMSLIASPVMAQTFYETFVITPDGHTPAQDIAFIVLDNVFGIKMLSGTGSATGFFESCISDLTTPCTDMQGNAVPSPAAYPFPIHFALHNMLYFYTMGIVFIAGAVLIYTVITIVGETATTGMPFGKRLNRAWFIPRLIMFFALIAPVSLTGNNAGINVAQMIVFSVAKFGSNMATNTWLRFNDAATVGTAEFLGKQQSLFAFPNVPEVGNLTQFMHVVRMCMLAEKMMNDREVLPYIVREHNNSTEEVRLHNGAMATYADMGNTTDDALEFLPAASLIIPFEQAVVFSRYKNVILRFGHRNPPGTGPGNPPGAYTDHWGFVEPTCGELHFDLGSLDLFVIGGDIAGSAQMGIQENYFFSIAEYFRHDLAHPMIDTTTLCMLKSVMPYNQDSTCAETPYTVAGGGTVSMFPYDDPTQWITVQAARSNIEHFNAANKYYLAGETVDWGTYARDNDFGVFNDMRRAYEDGTSPNNLLMPATIRERGWAGAALWYNKIAEVNGITASAMQNLPIPFKYPKIMEYIAEQHKAQDSNVSYTDRFNPRLQDGRMVDFPRQGDQYIAALLYNDYSFWSTANVQETTQTESSVSGFVDTVNMILGTQGLADILENDDTHPLAMLSYIGKSMVDASLRNLFAGAVGQGLGALLTDNFFGNLGEAAADFIVPFSLATLTIGFMLYYVMPFMPFIYFFFAFGGWIKSIFEAVVAMPLWALAHIKVDGEGLPGPWATNGYYLLFEIFLRPSLIVTGFLAGISVFSALVNVLHDLFHLVTLTTTGYDLEREIFSPTIFASGENAMQYWRSPIDELFYTAIYTIIVYMIGLSCFKLIDQVPNNIMRWIGVSVSTFHETMSNAAERFSGQMYRSTRMTNAQLSQMIDRLKGVKSDHVTDEMMSHIIGGGE